MREATTRQATALALKQKGLSYREIAQELKVNPKNVYRMMDVALLKAKRAEDKKGSQG